MMGRNILIIQGHPDKEQVHFGHALGQAYQEGADSAGFHTRQVTIATAEFPLLNTKFEFDHGQVPAAIKKAQDDILWADHIVIIYPLWLGAMPARLKGFFEQVFRPGFAMSEPESGHLWKKLLKGKSARIIVTMGMPAFFYRWFFGGHSLKNLQRNILSFSGIKPIKATMIGMVDEGKEKELKVWLSRVKLLGEKAI